MTKNDHKAILMIGKIKKPITQKMEGNGLSVTVEDIEKYLSEVKEAVKNNRYRIARNKNRQANIDLFLDYVIDENKAKNIMLNLTAMDFSEILHNEHKGFEYELLYVFGKDVKLLERAGNKEKTVSLYIKFNKLENCYLVVISFHEQRFPLNYYFK